MPYCLGEMHPGLNRYWYSKAQALIVGMSKSFVVGKSFVMY